MSLELGNLAAIPEEKRLKLMSHMTGLCVAMRPEVDTPAGEVLYKVVEDLFNHVDPITLRESAPIYAEFDGAPRSLMMKFATSDLEIAKPVLIGSRVFEDSDLIFIAQSKETGHRVAIATRDEISTHVTDCLIEFDEEQVLMRIAENDGARLSDLGYRAMAYNAREQVHMNIALRKRADLPSDIIKVLMTSKLPAFSPDASPSSPFKKALELSTEEKKFSVETRNLLRAIRDGRSTYKLVLSKLANEGKMTEFLQVMAVRLELYEGAIKRAFFNKNATLFTYLCRSVDMEEAAFEKLMQLRAERMHLSKKHSTDLMELFISLSPEGAEMLLQKVK